MFSCVLVVCRDTTVPTRAPGAKEEWGSLFVCSFIWCRTETILWIHALIFIVMFYLEVCIYFEYMVIMYVCVCLVVIQSR